MIRFSKKRRNISFDYTLEGSKLEFLDKIKYLGVYITNDLNWKYHINAMCNKASKTLGLLKRNLKMCPKSVKLQAYKGLVRPGLEYASAAWDPFQIYLQDKIEQVQKRSARFITGNYSYEPGSMTNILNDLKLTSLRSPGLDIGDRMVAIGDCEFRFGDCEKKSVAKLATVKFSSISFM